jgi:hypothetical protein
MKRIMLIVSFILPLMSAMPGSAQTDPALIHLNNYSYFYGRQYYVLRSGRTQMFIQSDKVDLGSAFTYLLFDAQNARQSARKDSASNYTTRTGFQTSALEVVMGGYPFVALGQNTVTKWVDEDGIPKVEAVWWAGGIRVTEKIFALTGMNTFVRSITLKGAQIIGKENVAVRLGVPEGNVEQVDGALAYSGPKGVVAVAAPGSHPAVIGNYLEIPVSIEPGSEKTFKTFVVTEIPSGDMGVLATRLKRLEVDSNALAETKEAWGKLTTIKTSDSVVQHIFDNVRFTLPGYISDVGIMDAGVFEYGGQWIRDASNTAVGLLQTGQFELTRSLLAYMMDSMITKEGATMISSSYEKPENEEFDQMGELWDALKNYYYWTGDASLLKDNASKLIAMTNRPLNPEFRDSTGMVHNKREYWERFLTDGYELAYQVWVIQGLRDAVELAPVIGAAKYVSTWQAAEEKMLNAMLHDPKMGLVSDGALIKRRALDGEVVDTLRYKGYIVDSPALTESLQRLLPDASMALPIAMGIVDPESPLARKTLSNLQSLWDSRWSFGGYDRYNTSSQPDQPGPWSFATGFMLRAQQEAHMYKLSRMTLECLYDVQGGHTGAYFEEIPINRHQEFTDGILPWPDGEVALFVVRHWLGVSFKENRIIIRPNLYPTDGGVKASLRFRKNKIDLSIQGPGKVMNAIVNGRLVRPQADGAVILPADFTGGKVVLETR